MDVWVALATQVVNGVGTIHLAIAKVNVVKTYPQQSFYLAHSLIQTLVPKYWSLS